MVEALYSLTYYANTPLVGIGFVLIVFLAAPRLSVSVRAVIASIAATVMNVGPGMLYNATSGAESEANPVIYFSIYLIPTFVVAWFLSWFLSKRTESKIGQTFK